MIENRKEEVRQQVKAYHRKPPELWELFVQFTFDMIDKGFKNYAVSGIFERIRWEKDMGGDGLTMFKINNNYKPDIMVFDVFVNGKSEGLKMAASQCSKVFDLRRIFLHSVGNGSISKIKISDFQLFLSILYEFLGFLKLPVYLH